MTNSEKAKQLVNEQWQWIADFIERNNLSKEDRNQIRFRMHGIYLEMAQWKDEQFKAEKQALIEKACEWLKDNANDYLDWYDWERCRVDKDNLLYDFKKAMEE